jgi:RecA/RadA recombinase
MDLFNTFQAGIGDSYNSEYEMEMIPFRTTPMNLLFGGGLALGQVHEWFGAEGSAKSTIAYETMAISLSYNVLPVLFDQEHAGASKRLQKFGLKPNENMLYIEHTVSIEHIFQEILRLAQLMKDKRDGRRLLFVIDSVGATPPEAHINTDDLRKNIKPGAMSLAWANMLRIYMARTRRILPGADRMTLLLLNHQTQVISFSSFGGPGPRYTSPGGHAVKHWGFSRARFINTGRLKSSAGDVVGATIKIETKKNKAAASHQEVEIPVYFGNPQLEAHEDSVGSWEPLAIHMHAKRLGLIAKGGMYILTNEGEDEWVAFSRGKRLY